MSRLLAVVFLLGVGCSAQAEDFAGSYHEKESGDVLTVEKTGEDQYTFENADWRSVLFWNKEAKQYAGVFRYNDSTSAAAGETGKSSKRENAVGYHSIVPKGNGTYEVTYQWSLSDQSGRGSYLIQKIP